jgi:hypothetical protein
VNALRSISSGNSSSSSKEVMFPERISCVGGFHRATDGSSLAGA